MARISGIHINLHTLSERELLAGIEHAEKRLDQVWRDLAKYNGEIALRSEPTVEIEPVKEYYPNE